MGKSLVGRARVGELGLHAVGKYLKYMQFKGEKLALSE